MLNNLKALLGLLIVIAGVAYYVTKADSEQNLTTRFLMPDWQISPDQIEAINKVQLEKDGEMISVIKEGGNWSIEGGFFANTETLSQLFQSIQSALIVEEKTANPKNHEQLNLGENGLKVSFFEDNKIVDAVFVGKNTGADLVFVRHENENQTYTVRGLKSIPFNLDSWQLKTILDYPADQVVKVEFNPAEEAAFAVQRNVNDLSLNLVDFPDGFQYKSDTQLSTLAAGLSRLMIDEALPVNLEGMELHSVNRYQLNDGSTVELQIYQKGEEYFLTVSGDKHLHYAPWMLKIAEYKFNALNKKLSDLIEHKADSESAVSVPEDPVE
ncbi:DUF4340 domain-containing protein [Marinicella litoralis]|uniref:Uncharacterized protein DUF4340 n=1 Tax=Marinicella litoralis TaxID=644220 RepID=A0A4R6XLE3_9GAMM|nr:DUF4340 domain-containing protein [Marinicella litoralis]TDR18397.1 uncharacterized protein DUF4340 [Marinicella litoralis]